MQPLQAILAKFDVKTCSLQSVIARIGVRSEFGSSHQTIGQTVFLNWILSLSATLRITAVGTRRQNAFMTWKTIRLELARTPRYPEGSAAHAYVLRLPVDDHGIVEAKPLHDAVEHPTVRRFWPHEPDQTGVVIKQGQKWSFSYRPGDEDDEAIFHLENHPIKLGEYLTITETNGEKLPFKVVSCHV
jgi:hypothetical protein